MASKFSSTKHCSGFCTLGQPQRVLNSPQRFVVLGASHRNPKKSLDSSPHRSRHSPVHSQHGRRSRSRSEERSRPTSRSFTKEPYRKRSASREKKSSKSTHTRSVSQEKKMSPVRNRTRQRSPDPVPRNAWTKPAKTLP